MSILVAMSSDKSTNWRRQATGISNAVAPFSTAISAIVTALCTGSIDPPRLISPTNNQATANAAFQQRRSRATNEAMPSFEPDFDASNARSCTVNSCSAGSLSRQAAPIWRRDSALRSRCSRERLAIGLLSTFTPVPGPSLTSIRYSPRAYLHSPWADAPHLSRLQWIAADAIVALQFWRRHELFNAIGTHDVAEVRVAELGCAHALLLLLHTATGFHRNAHRPLQVFIGYRSDHHWVD